MFILGLAALFHDQFLAASSGEKRATYTPDVEESDISDLEEASITSDPNQEDHPRQDVTAKADGDGGKRKLSTAVKMVGRWTSLLFYLILFLSRNRC